MARDIFSSFTEEDTSAFAPEITPEEEQQPETESVESLQARLKELDSAQNALISTLKAQGDNPNPKIVDRLAEIKKEKETKTDSLMSLLKERPAVTTAPVEPITGPASALSDVSAPSTKPKTIAEALGKKPEATTAQTPAAGPKAGEEIGVPPPPPPPPPPSPEDTLLSRLQKAETTKTEERKKADMGQLIETVARNIAQIGAAQVGMRKGIDLSNINKVQGTDWAAVRKEISDDYNTELASISKEREQLLQKQKQAADAENQKELLALRQKEFKLAERETNAKIKLGRDELDLKKAEAIKSAGTMTKEEREASRQYREEYNKANVDADKIEDATKKTLDSIAAADKLTAEGKGDSAGFEDRKAITAYLKALDPQSAVLAAEYVGAKTIGEKAAIFEKWKAAGGTEALKDWTTALLGGTLQPGVRAALKDATQTLLESSRAAQADKNKTILRSAYNAGIKDPVIIMGRNPRQEELDEVTGKVWGEAGATATTKSISETTTGRRSTGPSTKASELP